jgi:2-polyprenyl-6-methoxyphenol hydroxylase-like FAD-dependent oxidoreductase
VEYDVVIVGGGPNGLMLANELQLAGVRLVVLERKPVRTGAIRANGLVGRVVQTLHYRGMLKQVSDDMAEPAPMPFYLFGGLPLDLRGLEANPLFGLPIPQPRLEEFLEARALRLGVEIRRGHDLVDFSQDAESVVAEVAGPAGGYRLRARYLAGCDGASSTVRKRSGVGFPDLGPQSLVSRGADVVLPTSLVARVDGDQARGAAGAVVPLDGGLDLPGYGRIPFGFTRTSRGVFGLTSLEPGIHTVATNEWDMSSAEPGVPMSVEEMRLSVRRVLGVDLPMSPPHTAGPHRLHRLTGSSRQAENYRSGRVFLVGDAAHIHPPIGGPGLNLGLQDAVNLGWKLAAAVQGWAPDRLLDSFDIERRPVGRRVLTQTQAQLALMAPDTNTDSLRAVFSELLGRSENLRYVAELMAGADVRYDMGGDGAPRDGLVGGWAPDFALTASNGATRLAELMHPARPILLDLTEDAVFAHAAVRWKGRVEVVTGHADDAPADALLVRPDCYVVWAAKLTGRGRQGEPEEASLRAALATWFGAPAADDAWSPAADQAPALRA